MSLSAFDGRALLLVLAIVACAWLAAAVRRCSSRLNRDIPNILAQPAPAEPVIRRHAHALRRCTTCREFELVCIHEPDQILALMTEERPTCRPCAELLAELEQEVTS